MPGTAVSQAEHFVKLFPYELDDWEPEHRDPLVPALCEDGHQVSSWLARCLRAAGEEHLGRRLLSTLGRLTPLLGAELLCSSLFDEHTSGVLMALSTFLDHAKEDLPLWLLKHCQHMAMTSREAAATWSAEDWASPWLLCRRPCASQVAGARVSPADRLCLARLEARAGAPPGPWALKHLR